MQCFGLDNDIDCFRDDGWGNNDSDDCFWDWGVEADGAGSCDDDLLYTFKCAPLILVVTIFFPSKLDSV